jgi:membrane associated rhomboid family serine protease
MIFPIGDQNVVGGYRPIFSYIFILANVLAFLYQVSLTGPQMEAFVMEYGTIPSDIMAGENWKSIVTSMFLHGGWMHLLGNMMFLWVFGDNIEAVIGNFNFLGFYLLGGLAASLVHIGFNLDSIVPAVGASGAIAAVLGAYLIMFPRSRIRTLVFFFFVSIPALVFLGVWIVQQLVNGVGSLGLAEANTGGGVAWWAHIGGFAFGVIAGLYARRSFDLTNLELEGDRYRKRV